MPEAEFFETDFTFQDLGFILCEISEIRFCFFENINSYKQKENSRRAGDDAQKEDQPSGRIENHGKV